MGKSRSAPAPPDPKETAAAQTGTNVATAVAQQHLNNVNQVTPYGNLTFNQTGTYQFQDPNSGDTYDLPTYTATQTLSPTGEQIHGLNEQTQINLATIGRDQSARIGDLLGRPVDMSGLPDRSDPASVNLPDLAAIAGNAGDVRKTYGTDFSADRQRVEDALMSRLNPSLDRDRSALESRLAAQGIRIGSEAYQAAMGDFGRKSNDARMQAILAGGQEQSRLAGLEAQRAQFENAAQAQALSQGLALGQQGFSNQRTRNQDIDAARAAALNEQVALRNQPINEISALLSGSQVANPNFISPQVAQMPTVDIAGLTMDGYNKQLAAWQQAQQNRNNNFGVLGQLGSAYIGTL